MFMTAENHEKRAIGSHPGLDAYWWPKKDTRHFQCIRGCNFGTKFSLPFRGCTWESEWTTRGKEGWLWSTMMVVTSCSWRQLCWDCLNNFMGWHGTETPTRDKQKLCLGSSMRRVVWRGELYPWQQGREQNLPLRPFQVQMSRQSITLFFGSAPQARCLFVQVLRTTFGREGECLSIQLESWLGASVLPNVVFRGRHLPRCAATHARTPQGSDLACQQLGFSAKISKQRSDSYVKLKNLIPPEKLEFSFR